jgi:hypothetical protein
MTAVVGILNKHAVAVAADSAVTIGTSNNHKIFNKANKVFNLSKFHPVGIMIYNSASFMSTPWEIIIKVYRKQLEEKCFSTLEEYQKDFIEFLRSKNFYTDNELQLVYLENLISNVVNSFVNSIDKENPTLLDDPSPEDRAEFLRLFDDQIKIILETPKEGIEYCPEFTDYTIDDFKLYSNRTIETFIENNFIKNEFDFSAERSIKLQEVIFEILKSQETITSYTGLIFTGFGEEEIYPQLIPLNISMVVDNRLKYFIDGNGTASISNSMEGAIRPFAQTDVIDTILKGIDPKLEDIYLQNFEKTIKKFSGTIADVIGDSNPEIRDAIKALNTDKILLELVNSNNEIKLQNNINPLMNAVSSLSKEDLAEMAESLIYLTYLKRRITFAEESVGGPVDVAVISKGDGFVWIKRKHYFKPELNTNFFNNYLRK